MAKVRIFALVAAVVAFPSAGADSHMSRTSMLSDEQQVLALEQEWVDAEIKRDEGILRRVIDERFVVNSNDCGLALHRNLCQTTW